MVYVVENLEEEIINQAKDLAKNDFDVSVRHYVYAGYKVNVTIEKPSQPNVKPFKYKVGEGVWQMNRDQDFDPTTITACKRINGMNYYTTEMIDQWSHEDYLI